MHSFSVTKVNVFKFTQTINPMHVSIMYMPKITSKTKIDEIKQHETKNNT